MSSLPFKETVSLMMQNKAYALFCVLGTAFTFVFIIIVLQLAYTLTGNVPPFVNADRTIVFRQFDDKYGNDAGGIEPEEMFSFLKQIKDKDEYYIYYPVMDQISANGKYKHVAFSFVNGGFWKVNRFDLLDGRLFTEKDCEDGNKVIVVTEKVAREFFNDVCVVGKKMEVQGDMYTIVGVVADYSTLTQQGVEMWLPYPFNKFVPDQTGCYRIGVLVAGSVDEMKKQLAQRITEYMRERGIELDLRPEMLHTKQEEQIREFGSDVFAYGIPLALALLLFVPAINIVTLNMANANGYVGEVALRKALGATRQNVFWQKMAENLFVVIVGVLLGFVLVVPVVRLVSGGLGISLVSHVGWPVVLCVFPLVLLFACLSGALPARRVAWQNIGAALKGNVEKLRSKWKVFLGIGVEQVFAFVVLMMGVVAVVNAIRQYREPGLLNVDDRIGFGYMLLNYGDDLSWEERREVSLNMDVVLESLRAAPYVEGITESMGVIPYLRGETEEIFDSIIAGNQSVRVMLKMGDEKIWDVLEPELVEGKWFEGDRLDDGSCPVIVTRQMLDELGWECGVGRQIQFQGGTFTIVGVLAGLKQQVFGELFPTLIIPVSVWQTNLMYREFCAKVSSGHKDDFIALLNKECQRLGLSKAATIVSFEMNDMAWMSMSGTVTNLVMQSVPTVFLVFFAFIGTFGLFWLTAKRRRREFALRMVMGCTRRGLARLVVGESLCVTGLAMVPGLLLSFFIYDWTATQALAIGLTILLMLLFSVFSAWWPARQVSRLRPADVLREE